jgi:electron-transferring-flavoprotein dehydrogenase
VCVQVQNIRPGFKFGLWAGLLNTFLESYVHPLVLGGSPWLWSHQYPDHMMMQPAQACKAPRYETCVPSSFT